MKTNPDTKTPVQNLMEAAASNGSFKTFARAVDKAGLKDTLGGAGPFTVFAPTDAAFAKLPAGKLDELFKPENKTELTAILNYHVVDGRRATWRPAVTPGCRPAKVWMFGGSTAFGQGQRDDHTIASELARVAWEDGIAVDVTKRVELEYQLLFTQLLHEFVLLLDANQLAEWHQWLDRQVPVKADGRHRSVGRLTKLGWWGLPEAFIRAWS